ncbi:MAG: hypothetical protein HW409_881 [candidate division NC10 bacterium]|nr:hypothetical protein [candidate division NC10 bacterium]
MTQKKEQMEYLPASDPQTLMKRDTKSCWSGRLDLNQRPLAPHASALPGCATPRTCRVFKSGGMFPQQYGDLFQFLL